MRLIVKAPLALLRRRRSWLHHGRRALYSASAPTTMRKGGVWWRLIDRDLELFHLGLTADMAREAQFVDPVRPDSILHQGTPVFMVEGEAGMTTLMSPMSGYIVETNAAVIGHLDSDVSAAMAAAPDAAEHWIVAMEADVEVWDTMQKDDDAGRG